MSLLRTIFPWRLGFVNAVLSGLYLLFLIAYQFKVKVPTLQMTLHDLVPVATGLVTVNLLWLFLGAATARCARVRTVLAIGLISYYAMLGVYHHLSTESLDLSVLLDNAGGVFAEGASDVFFHTFGAPVLGTVLGVVVLLALLERRRGLVSRCVQDAPRWPKVIVTGGLYGAVMLTQIPTADEVTYSFQSVAHYYLSDLKRHDLYTPGTYPFIRTRTLPVTADPTPATPPNILVVMVESFRAGAVGQRTEDGREVTPNFNRLMDQGWYVDHHYSNSMQTCKGQFSFLTSLAPSIRGKEFVRYAHRRLMTLPAVLRDHGYRTVFFQAAEELGFDNTEEFVRLQGFEIVESAASFATEEDAPHTWGFGLQDDRFYNKFFTHFDRLRATSDERPTFAVLATISNHMYFSKVPADRRHLYPEPQNMEQAYANSVHLSDRGLAVFFEELERRPWLADSLVIITGDHGFPMGEHGYYHNEIGAFDEFFRVPFLMLWKGHLAPRRIRETAFSHMDVAPTLLDLLQLPVTRHHFQGTSMVPEPPITHPIPLVQPYNGQQLGVVDWPHKYIVQTRTGDEQYYDLEQDPGETDNRLDQLDATRREAFESQIERLMLNQILLEADEVWPP